MPEQQPTTSQANTALFVLLLAYILSFIDRNVMAVLIGPIREQFDITDFQYSLLHGFAFSMFYIVLGLPIARLADRHNRKWIITIGVFCWSVMTCLCGLAKSFATLFIARIGVGVGEAALSPPAYSLLADAFPPEKLARAMAVYTLGITLGGGLAYIIGGAVYQHFAAQSGINLPLLGHIAAWQVTFIVVGAPGFILVLLLGAIREPPRRVTSTNPHRGASLSEIRLQLQENRGAYLGLIGSMSLLAVVGYGTMAWYPEFLIRSYGITRADAGMLFGTLFIIAGSLGAVTGGWSVKPLEDLGCTDAPMRIILGVALLWIIPGALGPLAPNITLAVVAAAPIAFLQNAYFGVGIAGIQFITPSHMRAQVSALMLFSTNLFGLAFGPSAIALLTDFLFSNDQSLRYSLFLMPLVICPLAALLVWRGLSSYQRAIDSQAL